MDIKLEVNGASIAAYLALPSSEKGLGILLIQTWWDLIPFFSDLYNRLAQKGFVVQAPDLNKGGLVLTIEDTEARMNSRDSHFKGDAIMSAKDFLLSDPACLGQKLGKDNLCTN